MGAEPYFTTNYSFAKDTLYWHFSRTLRAQAPLSKIKSIQFKGVWDKEIGAISQERIVANRITNRRTELAVLYGALGGVVGLLPSAGIAVSLAGFDEIWGNVLDTIIEELE